MRLRRFARRFGIAVAVLAASFVIVPSAFARVHVGVGISVPGVSIGVGNCWNCGYVPAPVYYPAYGYAAPAYYPAPVYYPAPAYYAPRPAYYGGYYGPRYPRYYRGHDRGHWSHHDRGGYYHHGHR